MPPPPNKKKKEMTVEVMLHALLTLATDESE
jgi:hypothetical protein